MMSDSDLKAISAKVGFEFLKDYEIDMIHAAYALGVERARKAHDAATRAVIERLADSLQVANNFLKLAENNLGVEPSGDYDAPLIAEARKLLADGGWIRVEDALPESGVPVIAYVPHYGGQTNSRRIRAQYAAKHSLEQHMEADGGDYDEASDTYYCEPGWYEDNEYEEIHWRVSDEVTHWQPLPQPPEGIK